MYHYELLDPAAPSQPAAPDPLTLGIEVTIARLAALCGLGNIDPQHGSAAGPDAPAAITASLDWPVPPAGARLVTIRADLDALGAMAVLALRADGIEFDAAMRTRVARIDRADRFDHGPWFGPRPLPDSIEDILGDAADAGIAALAAAAMDRSEPLVDRVALIGHWLLTGEAPAVYMAARRGRSDTLIRSLRVGATRVEYAAEGCLGVVVSLEPDALRLGYRLAPVVVALNPAYTFHNGRRGRKFTIAQFAAGHADLHSAAEELSRLEPGWGGSATIKGSPQDRPSGLSVEQVTKIVAMALLKPERIEGEEVA